MRSAPPRSAQAAPQDQPRPSAPHHATASCHRTAPETARAFPARIAARFHRVSPHIICRYAHIAADLYRFRVGWRRVGGAPNRLFCCDDQPSLASGPLARILDSGADRRSAARALREILPRKTVRPITQNPLSGLVGDVSIPRDALGDGWLGSSLHRTASCPKMTGGRCRARAPDHQGCTAMMSTWFCWAGGEGHTEVWLAEPGNGAAGTSYFELEFSNTGRRTCTLRGYPVSWPSSTATRSAGPAAHLPAAHPLVTLRPGVTAHAILSIGDVLPCPHPVTADLIGRPAARHLSLAARPGRSRAPLQWRVGMPRQSLIGTLPNYAVLGSRAAPLRGAAGAPRRRAQRWGRPPGAGAPWQRGKNADQ